MRLSPLNIVLACVLLWGISELGEDGDPLFSWGWLLLLAFLIVVADILFRVWIPDTKRLWVFQVAFVIIVGICTVLVKII